MTDLSAETGSGDAQIGVSPDEREVFLATGSGEPSARLLGVDLASGEIRGITDLPAAAVDLCVSPYEDGGLLVRVGASDDPSGRSRAVRIERATGTVHALPTTSDRGRWRHLAWWGRGHVLGIEERAAGSGADDARVRRAVSAELTSGSVRTLDSVPARSVGGSPDGRRVVIADTDGDVWVVHLPRGERRLLAGVGRDEVTGVDPDPCFSPDGRGVLMQSDRFGPTELVLAQLPEFTALPLPYERSARRRRN